MSSESAPPPATARLLACAPAARFTALRAALGPLGHVDMVETIASAVAAARAGAPDLVVVELGAAGADGVRSFRRELPGPITVLLSDGTVDRAAAYEAGADDWIAAPFTEAELRGLVATRLRDLDHRRGERGEAESAARARDEFLSLLAHELRTPLGAILIWTQLLSTESFDEAGLERALRMIERSARTLAQLIDDLQDLARIVSGKLRLDMRAVDFGSLVEAGAAAARATDEGRVITVSPAAPGAGRTVCADAARLRQVVCTLVNVVAKAAAPGAVVEATTDCHDGTFHLQVQSPGEPGGEPPPKMGLRLTLARRLVELHGGSLDVASVARLRLSLPAFAAVSGSEPGDVHPAAAGGMADLRGLCVLLVDDEEDAREGLRLVLERSGASVCAVDSARAALEAFQRERFDVLVSDISMPNEDGYSLIRRVRAMGRERGGDVPAAAVTAFSSESDRDRARSSGYVAHLAKPVEPRALVQLVADLSRSAPRPAPSASDPLRSGQ